MIIPVTNKTKIIYEYKPIVIDKARPVVEVVDKPIKGWSA